MCVFECLIRSSRYLSSSLKHGPSPAVTRSDVFRLYASPETWFWCECLCLWLKADKPLCSRIVWAQDTISPSSLSTAGWNFAHTHEILLSYSQISICSYLFEKYSKFMDLALADIDKHTTYITIHQHTHIRVHAVNFKVIFLNTIVFAFEAQYRGQQGWISVSHQRFVLGILSVYLTCLAVAEESNPPVQPNQVTGIFQML